MHIMRAGERGVGSVLWLLVLLGGCIVQRVECKHDSQFDKIIDGLPPGFVLGTASAAYQVGRGGRGPGPGVVVAIRFLCRLRDSSSDLLHVWKYTCCGLHLVALTYPLPYFVHTCACCAACIHSGRGSTERWGREVEKMPLWYRAVCCKYVAAARHP